MKRLTFKYDLRDCPPIEELEKFRRGTLPKKLDGDITHHLTFCKICSAKVTVLEPETSEEIPETLETPAHVLEKVKEYAHTIWTEQAFKAVQAQIQEAPGPIGSFEPGYISLTKEVDTTPFILPDLKGIVAQASRLVLVLESHDPMGPGDHALFRVALISLSTEYKGPYDVVVPIDEGPFSIPLMVECWNTTLLTGDLIADHGYHLDDISRCIKRYQAYEHLKRREKELLPQDGKTKQFCDAERKVLQYLWMKTSVTIDREKAVGVRQAHLFPRLGFTVPLLQRTAEVGDTGEQFRVNFSGTEEGTHIATLRVRGSKGATYMYILNSLGEEVIGWKTDENGLSDVYLGKTGLPPGNYALEARIGALRNVTAQVTGEKRRGYHKKM